MDRKKIRLYAVASIATLALGGAGAVYAADAHLLSSAAVMQQTGGSGHDAGTTHDSGTHEDGGQPGGSGQVKGQGKRPGEVAGSGHGSMDDIFRAIGSEEEDSDRPAWAGAKGGKNEHGTKPGSAGSARGDLYGDMYVILRDDNGVPILTPEGFVQPIDANGNPVPLDAEGAPIDPSLAQEIELGRLNSSRSPNQVLDQRASEVVNLLNTATAISLDPAGRLVITDAAGVTKTIDAPLENMALYVALMTTGTIPGVTDLPGTEFDYLVDGKLTAQDMQTATSLLAAAADKYTSLSLDAVAYLNAILGINTVTQGTVTYSSVDYSNYTYDRSDTYSGQTVTVLVKQPDGSYVPTTVNVYDVVFKDQDYTNTGFDAFATAADDARAVISYIHDNEAPE